MTNRIAELSDGQRALLAAVRDEWIGHGLSARPADRPAAEEGVRAAHRAAGLEPPRIMIWLGSPSAGCVGAAMLASLPSWEQEWGPVRDQVGEQVAAKIWARLGEQAWDRVGQEVADRVWVQVRSRVRDKVGEQVEQVRNLIGGQIQDHVWSGVRDNVEAEAHVGDNGRNPVDEQVRDRTEARVWTRVGGQVWAQIRGQVAARDGRQVRDLIENPVRDEVDAGVWAGVWDYVAHRVLEQIGLSGWGQHDVWMPFYDYFQRIGVAGADPLTGLMQVARSAGWWWSFENAAILTERPTQLHRDRENRLHRATGPAVSYPDGFAVHARHGALVPSGHRL